MKISSKKAMDGSFISKIVASIVGVVVLFALIAGLLPTAQTQGNAINTAGLPLGSLFAGSGIVFTLIMAAILLAVVYAFLPSKKK